MVKLEIVFKATELDQLIYQANADREEKKAKEWALGPFKEDHWGHWEEGVSEGAKGPSGAGEEASQKAGEEIWRKKRLTKW